MRLSMIRAGVLATVAAVVLSACSGGGMPGYGGGYTPSAPNAAPVSQQSEPSGVDQNDRDNNDAATAAPVTTATATANALALPAVTTCDKSPPQYWWIFKGACDPKIELKSTGATFSLAKYQYITVSGTIGNNTTKGTATIAIADAVDKNGDITNWKGKAFPKYTAKGVFIYAVAVNQSNQTIKPKPVKGKPVLQYVVSDTKGLPGKTCSVALLAESQSGKFIWTPFPGSFKAKGNTVTITQYEVPKGFEIPPKTPLYFAVNCY